MRQQPSGMSFALRDLRLQWHGRSSPFNHARRVGDATKHFILFCVARIAPSMTPRPVCAPPSHGIRRTAPPPETRDRE
jgi:hypothetical protein